MLRGTIILLEGNALARTIGNDDGLVQHKLRNVAITLKNVEKGSLLVKLLPKDYEYR